MSPEGTSAEPAHDRALDRRGRRLGGGRDRRTGRSRWVPSRSPRRRARPRSGGAPASWRGLAAGRARRPGGRSRVRRPARPDRLRRARAAAPDRAARGRRRSGRARRRRRPSRAPSGSGTSTAVSGGSSTGSTRSPTPCTSAWRGSSWLGTSEPRSAASLSSSSEVSGPPASSLAIRSAAAASALPPPSPAATGMRLSILYLQRGEPATRARAEVGQRPRREVVVRHAGADDGVGARVARRGGQLVGEIDRRHQRADRMHAVLARATHVQDQVELGVGELAEHGREATRGVAAPRAARGRSRRPAAASRPGAAARRARPLAGRAARGRRAWRRGCRPAPPA